MIQSLIKTDAIMTLVIQTRSATMEYARLVLTPASLHLALHTHLLTLILLSDAQEINALPVLNAILESASPTQMVVLSAAQQQQQGRLLISFVLGIPVVQTLIVFLASVGKVIRPVFQSSQIYQLQEN